MDTPEPQRPHPLRVYRVGAGWTQRELADLAGVNQFTVSRLERRLHTPNLTTAEAIARALGRPVDAVFPPGQQAEPGA